MKQSQMYHVYIGAYTEFPSAKGKAKGIHIYRLNGATGELALIGVAPGIINPSFLTFSADARFLYAVSEILTYDGKKSGAVSAFSIDRASGMLTMLNQQPTQGPGACHISIDATGKWALITNYHGGSVAVLPVLGNGSLGAPVTFIQHSGPSRTNPQRQEAAHAHSIIPAPGNRVVLVADLGMDKIVTYRLNTATGALTPHDPPFIAARPGAGPRHQVFHPNGRFYYVVNELDSTVSVIKWDAARDTGREIQYISTLPAGFTAETTTAEIRISPDGRFVYASNRGHDSIAIFKVDQRNGKLTSLGQEPTQGRTPRNFELTPTGDLLIAANQESDNLVVFRRSKTTGLLTPTGHVAPAFTPVCVRMLPAA